jgi:hypothetical protein
MKWKLEITRGICCVMIAGAAFCLLHAAWGHYKGGEYPACLFSLFLVGCLIYHTHVYFRHCFLTDDLDDILKGIEGEDVSKEDETNS